jgi:hypothetical protein
VENPLFLSINKLVGRNIVPGIVILLGGKLSEENSEIKLHENIGLDAIGPRVVGRMKERKPGN